MSEDERFLSPRRASKHAMLRFFSCLLPRLKKTRPTALVKARSNAWRLPKPTHNVHDSTRVSAGPRASRRPPAARRRRRHAFGAVSAGADQQGFNKGSTRLTTPGGGFDSLPRSTRGSPRPARVNHTPPTIVPSCVASGGV